jgi:hypothetical protein
MVEDVTVVRDSFRLVRLSHVCCAKSGATGMASVATAIAEAHRLNIEDLP